MKKEDKETLMKERKGLKRNSSKIVYVEMSHVKSIGFLNPFKKLKPRSLEIGIL